MLFGCRGGFVVEGVLISAFVKCFLVRGGRLCRMRVVDADRYRKRPCISRIHK